MPRPIPDVPPTKMATGFWGRACPALEERTAANEVNMVALYRMRIAMMRAAAWKIIIMRRTLTRYNIGFRIGRPKRRVCPVASYVLVFK